MVAKLIKFFKRVRRGAKTVTKVKELLLPELANFPLTAPQGKQASKLINGLYIEALEKEDFNALDFEGEEWTRAGYVICYGLTSIGDSRVGFPVASALSSALLWLTTTLEVDGVDTESVETFKKAEANFRSIVEKRWNTPKDQDI